MPLSPIIMLVASTIFSVLSEVVSTVAGCASIMTSFEEFESAVGTTGLVVASIY